MSTEPEGQWAEAMERVRATDPRTGRPSWNQLAAMSGVSTTTITMMVNGTRKASVSTIAKVAEALRVTPNQVRLWLGEPGKVTTYQVPDEVHLLTPRQQKALTELIRAVAAEQSGGDGDGDAAPTSQAGVTLRSTGSRKSYTQADRAAARSVKSVSRGQQARADQDSDAH